MYQIDFNHPSSIYFVGIGGISMSGRAYSDPCGCRRKL